MIDDVIDDIDDETDGTDRETSWRMEERTSRNSKNAGLGALILPNSLTPFCVELQTMTMTMSSSLVFSFEGGLLRVLMRVLNDFTSIFLDDDVDDVEVLVS